MATNYTQLYGNLTSGNNMADWLPWIQQRTDNWFGATVFATIVVLVFVALQSKGYNKAAFASSGFVSLVLGGMMFWLGLLPGTFFVSVMVIGAGLAIASLFFN